jgi:hypothetical protein
MRKMIVDQLPDYARGLRASLRPAHHVDHYDRCPCGWVHLVKNRTEHAARHLDWHEGILLRPSIKPRPLIYPGRGGFMFVSAEASMGWQQLAYDMARMAKREGGWDGVSFPYPSTQRRFSDDDDVQAALYLRDGSSGIYAIGFVSLYNASYISRWHPITKVQEKMEGMRRIRLGPIWVANGWRRHGVASALIESVAAGVGVDPSELAWSIPFTDAGLALATTFSDPEGWLWIT